MSVGNKLSRFSHRKVGVVLAGTVLAGFAAAAGPAMATSSSMNMSSTAASGADHVGNTDGWLNGETYRFHYTKNYFCRVPPTAASSSNCEVGATYNRIPAKAFDPLYVIVPVGFTPPTRTLQCPTAGMCIDHPHTLDLSRVFGSGTGNALLPPHSHIVTTGNMHQSEWWNVIVIGITDQPTWGRIVSGKSYRTIQNMRRSGNKHITDNIASNLFLYFSVQGK